MNTDLPLLKWGVLGTGTISSIVVRDLLLERPDAQAIHRIVAIGSSSIEKAERFVSGLAKDPFIPESAQGPKEQRANCTPALYDSYDGVYGDSNVDIVYVGTPNVAHKRNVLDAIAAGKHVLCEKPMAMNEKEACEMVAAARDKGVFLMEGVWTRFFPLVTELQRQIHELKIIGDVQRVFVDYGMDRSLDAGPGPSSLLDIGIYAITWASIALGKTRLGTEHPSTTVAGVDMDIRHAVDESAAIILKYNYPADENTPPATAILTTTFRYKTGPDFCEIQGTKGIITVSGLAGSCPLEFSIRRPYTFPELIAQMKFDQPSTESRQVYKFKQSGTGYGHEADAIALDISNGRLENATMPLDESLRMMRLMDECRRRGGVVYPQDEE